MISGYMGKILIVDLTTGDIKEQELTEDMARNFVGGYGIGARLLYSMMKSGVDPLGPESILGFMTGPLTGTGAFFSGRFTVVCKSPVTGGWNDANCGGFFGPELKRAGYDAVLIKGAAAKPVYLWIKDGKAEIRDAAKLWGKDVAETEAALAEEAGDKRVRAAVIGPAGEKLSLMAAIMTDRHRAVGRGGPGAVMGSKNLKAVAVRGTLDVPVAHPDALKAINQEIAGIIKNSDKHSPAGAFAELGTTSFNAPSALNGDSPVKNWGGVGIVDFGEEAVRKIDGFAMDAKYKTKKYACANCALGCGAHYVSKDGKWPVGETDRPEYETTTTFGILCLNSDTDSIVKCNHICNLYGLDTIAAGATVAWAIECYENGLITKKDTDGIELTWGNAQAIVDITQAIADQTGFGKILAQGSEAAAKKLGKGFEYLTTVRGIEIPMHDPKLGPGFARTYQLDPTPARHVKGGLGFTQGMTADPNRYSYEGTGMMDQILTSAMEVVNSVGLCMFCQLASMPGTHVRMLEAVTGWSLKDDEASNMGMRIMNMRQAFNLREGLKPADFILPKRTYGEPPQAQGPLAGITVDYKALGRNFFEVMNWDEVTGRPSRESLTTLGGLDDVIRDLYR